MSEEKLIATREKPVIPEKLGRFKLLHTFLKEAPYGPTYVPELKTFLVDGLHGGWIEYIKEERNNYDPIAMCKHLALEFNITSRAENIVSHYHHGEKEKFWKLQKSDYVKRLEKQFVQVGKGSKDAYQNFYRPYVEWLIQQGYEFCQVGQLLGRTPTTIRMWANDWGYKEHTRITTKMPNFAGKVSRVEHNEVMTDASTHSMKVFQDMPKSDEVSTPTWSSLGKEISLVWKHFVALLFKRRK